MAQYTNPPGDALSAAATASRSENPAVCTMVRSRVDVQAFCRRVDAERELVFVVQLELRLDARSVGFFGSFTGGAHLDLRPRKNGQLSTPGPSSISQSSIAYETAPDIATSRLLASAMHRFLRIVAIVNSLAKEVRDLRLGGGGGEGGG